MLRCCGGRCRRRCASTAVVISARRCPSATSVFVVSRSIRATRFTEVVNRRVSNTIIARYNGAIGGVGFGGKLRPGDHPTLTGLVSTASCDVTLGYALPPGRYTVQFLFGGYNTAANGGTKIEQFVSTPIPLTVTNEPPPPLPVQAPLSPITIVPGSGGGGPGSILPAIHPGARAVAVRWVHHLTSGKPTDPCTRTDLARAGAADLSAGDAKGLRSLRDRLGDAFACGVVLHYGDRVQRLEERIFALPVSSLWSTWRWMPIRLPPGQTRFRHAFRCELRGFLQRNARMLRGLGPVLTLPKMRIESWQGAFVLSRGSCDGAVWALRLVVAFRRRRLGLWRPEATTSPWVPMASVERVAPLGPKLT